ncbi:MAG: hypothetical protein KJO07_14640, partial [Deltaproteobacteria bacterium]|nr:hypothetical protein [Deltaproteobacteria bacterium]
MKIRVRSLLSLALAFGVALSVPASEATAKAKDQDKFTVRVKLRSSSGKLSYATVGRIVRAADGTVTATAIRSKRLDRLSDRFVTRWKSYRHPKSISITEEFSVDTGMSRATQKRTYRFSPNDRLYPAAVVRRFIEKHGYESIDVDIVKFIRHDLEPSRAKPGEHIHDEARKLINFRKGTEAGYADGK